MHGRPPAYLPEHPQACATLGTKHRRKETLVTDKPEPVIALFDSAVLAEMTARRLNGWMRSNSLAQLDALGILAKDDDGTVSMRKLGPRETWKGVGVGLLTGALTARRTDELTMLQGLAVGAAGGGAAGLLFRRNVRLSPETRSRIAQRLRPGGAAVVALVAHGQVAAVTEKLVEYGGAPDESRTAPGPTPAATPAPSS
jgi:uncharacterized membrane protein